jgi:hypothetical protein
MAWQLTKHIVGKGIIDWRRSTIRRAAMGMMWTSESLCKHYSGVRKRLIGKGLKPWHKPTVVLVWSTPKIECIAYDPRQIMANACTLSTILKEVARHYGVTVEELKGKSRIRELTKIRFVYYYRAATETNASYPRIGRMCGYRDHSTVWHGMRKYCADHNLPVPRRPHGQPRLEGN